MFKKNNKYETPKTELNADRKYFSKKYKNTSILNGLYSKTHFEENQLVFGSDKNHKFYYDRENFEVNKDGRHWVKINDKMEYRYRLKVLPIIEDGKLPKNIAIHHKDGDPANDSFFNIDITNAKIHLINAGNPNSCPFLEKASISLEQYSCLDSLMELTDQGYLIHADFPLISQSELERIANCHTWICPNCNGCKHCK